MSASHLDENGVYVIEGESDLLLCDQWKLIESLVFVACVDVGSSTGQQRSKLMNIVNRGKNIFKRSDETASVFDSDDDDALSTLNESQFERKAARGIIEFRCFHVKSMGAKKRVFHLDVATNVVRGSFSHAKRD